MRITRRQVLTGLVATGASGFGLSAYAFGVEPAWRLVVTRHVVASRAWPATYPPLTIAVLSDVHACDPWMPVERINRIVARTLKLEPDLIVVLGDMAAGLRNFRTRAIEPDDWAAPLARLKAPLGVHAVLGNHDWWTDIDAVRHGFARARIRVYENDAVKLRLGRGRRFWLAGLGDQLAFALGGDRFRGVDDLPGTLRAAGDGSPIVLMVHEPDIFVDVPRQVALTLAGHTHGGQVAMPVLGRPIVPSRYGQRFAYGHVVEEERNLVISGGLGCSILPVRFGVPPEITLVTMIPAAA